MNISVEIVRKLAKLDPELRETFYSFVDEFYKEQDKSLTKEDIKDLSEKLEPLSHIDFLKKEIESLKTEYLSLQKKLDSKLSERDEKIKELASQIDSIKDFFTSKLEELVTIQKEVVNSVSKNKDVDYSKVVSSIEDNTKGLKEITKELKESFNDLLKNIKLVSTNRILSKLPKTLKKKLSLNIKEHFISKVFEVKGKKVCFPIFGSGTKNKKLHTVVGTVLDTPTKKDIDEFLDAVSVLQKEKELPSALLKVLVVEQIERDLEKVAEKKGITVIWMQDL
ncbi:hypothetical protein JCM13304A_22850 [Desulfothermus okinawensis JCM 13304]